MKKCRYVWLLTVICIIVLQLVACGNDANTGDGNDGLNSGITGDGNGEGNGTTDGGDGTTDGGNGTEDTKLGFTVEYDLNELRTYFESGHQNESMGGLGGEKPKLTREAVKIKYPIEIERTCEDVGGTGDRPFYAMYKVSQGGYYYVWWRLFKNLSTGESENCVYFSAYLVSDRSVELFDSIIPGVSTAADVKKIDPYIQFCFEFSSRTPSFSYINGDTVLEICYTWSKLDSYEDLVVSKMELRNREILANMLYLSILPGDRP